MTLKWSERKRIIDLASCRTHLLLTWLFLLSFCSALPGAPGLAGSQLTGLKYVLWLST